MPPDAPALVSLEDHLCFSLYSTHMAVQRAYRAALEDIGLTYPQYLVMTSLWTEDRQGVGQLADGLSLESSTLTPLLQRLEAAGLVNRQRDPANERRVVISLTEAGSALRAKAHCVSHRLLSATGMSAAELAQINTVVKRLRDAVGA